MTKLSDIPPGENISLLLYGGSGAGKTFFGGSAGSNSVFYNLGNGIATLTSKHFKNKNPDANPEIITIMETVDKRGLAINPTGFDSLCDHLDTVLASSDTIKTIVIDDLTSLYYLALNKAYDLNKGSNKSQTLMNAQRNRDIPLTAVQDYGTVIDILKFFFGTYTTLCKKHGKHFIVLAHERTIFKPGKMGEEAKLFKVIPHAPGKDNFAPSVLPAFFDEVYHISIRGGERTIRTKPNDIYLAKTRYEGALKEFETNLTFSSWINKIEGNTSVVASNPTNLEK